MLKKWNELPAYMQTKEVRPYYEILKKQQGKLMLKRILDFSMATYMFILFSPIFVIIALSIVIDTHGGIFFRQERITQYGRKFKIYKFRTMVRSADKIGTHVTLENDKRITHVGKILRKYRLDELPQLINIIIGDMSFVGTRPESTYYVRGYTKEMLATLLLPAGVTSEASVKFKDEEKLLNNEKTVDENYLKEILPRKMEYNLKGIKNFSLLGEFSILIKTIFAVIR